MPGGFFIYQADEQEQILYANKALLRIFNCDTFEEFEQLTGNSFQGIVHPEDLDEVQKSIQEQIASSRYDLDYVEYRIIQKGGNVRWIEDYGHFVHSQNLGDIFYVFVGDATEKRQRLLKEEKEKDQEYLRRLEVIQGLSVNYDSILYANLETDTILPYRASERIGFLFGSESGRQNYQAFIANYAFAWVSSEDQELFRRVTDPSYIRKKLHETNTYYVNYRILEGQESRYLQLRIADVSKDDQVSRIVLGTRQVDDEIRHEIEQKKLFENALQQAKLANITKNTFLSNMSHDIRTPLNAITGYTTLAKNHGDDPAKVQEYLEKIEMSADQLLHLLNDVLEISRLESGAVLIEPSECSLEHLLQELTASALPKADKKQISLSADLVEVTHKKVFVDAVKLKQVLLCLISNAIKYTGSGGAVQIQIQEKEALANDSILYKFIVKDNGIGICEEFHKTIFEPFERVNNTTHSGVFGTGLGLTIAKYLIELMGGTIQVSSAPGIGSTFTVSLNLARALDSACTYTDDRESISQMMHGRKILLVEDNEINREIETELLEDLGFLVDTAEDGSVAVDLVSRSAPDEYALIFMDIQMPLMDGYEATQAIRRLQDPALAQIPIIALSANSFAEDQQRSLESGMNAHLAKPLNLPELLELIIRFCAKEADPNAPEGIG